MYSYGPPHMAVQKQDDQHEHTFSSYVRIRDAVLKTYLGRWTIGRSGERGSGISVLPARYDDDDDDDDIVLLYGHMQYHNDTIIKMQEDFFRKIFIPLTLFVRVRKDCVGFYSERELETEHKL